MSWHLNIFVDQNIHIYFMYPYISCILISICIPCAFISMYISCISHIYSLCPNISIYILCMYVCLYRINVKTAVPIRTKFCVGHHMTLGKIYEWSKFFKICLQQKLTDYSYIGRNNKSSKKTISKSSLNSHVFRNPLYHMSE